MGIVNQYSDSPGVMWEDGGEEKVSVNKQNKNLIFFFSKKFCKNFSIFSNKLKYNIGLGKTEWFHLAGSTFIPVIFNNKN